MADFDNSRRKFCLAELMDFWLWIHKYERFMVTYVASSSFFLLKLFSFWIGHFHRRAYIVSVRSKLFYMRKNCEDVSTIFTLWWNHLFSLISALKVKIHLIVCSMIQLKMCYYQWHKFRTLTYVFIYLHVLYHELPCQQLSPSAHLRPWDIKIPCVHVDRMIVHLYIELGWLGG